MTQAERVNALRYWGYSPLQAEFLVTAALASGYFVRRQFDMLHNSGSQSGRFLDKLLERGHVQVIPFPGRRNLYHMNYAPMYRVLGGQSVRPRRGHGIAGVQARLTGLDFILSRNGCAALLTAADKREYLLSCGVSSAHLPAASDRHPVMAEPSGEVIFAYVEGSDATVKGFETWMRQHQELFRCLEHFRLVYTCCYADLAPAARAIFESRIMEVRPQEYPASARDLLDYFRLRREFETCRRYAEFDIARLQRLKDAKVQYAGEKYEEIYRRWKTDGASALGVSGRVRFEVQMMSHDYGWLPGGRRILPSDVSASHSAASRAKTDVGESSDGYGQEDGGSSEVEKRY